MRKIWTDVINIRMIYNMHLSLALIRDEIIRRRKREWYLQNKIKNFIFFLDSRQS